jgi:hypothetical protein
MNDRCPVRLKNGKMYQPPETPMATRERTAAEAYAEGYREGQLDQREGRVVTWWIGPTNEDGARGYRDGIADYKAKYPELPGDGDF